MNGYLFAIRGNDDSVPLGMWPTLGETLEWLSSATPEELIDRYEEGVECVPDQKEANVIFGASCWVFSDGRPLGPAKLPERLCRRVVETIARSIGCEDVLPR